MDPRRARRVNEVLGRLGWRVQRVPRGLPNPIRLWDEDADFLSVWSEVSRTTLVPVEAAFVLWRLARTVGHLEGRVGELGVYQGGTARLLRRALPGTPLDLFDTFTGLPPPDRDRDLLDAGHFADTSADAVARFVGGEQTHLWPGHFPGSAPHDDRRYRLVHVDADLYQSVRDSCDYFFPRLVAGGVIVFDDYGWRYCPGARQALDEYCARRGLYSVYLPTGQALLLGGR